MADEELPYVAEYAKSNRSSCKKCKNKIEKDHLRIGIMVQSPHFDSKIPLWHHHQCFFQKAKLNSTGDVKDFTTLRYEDQQKLKDLMAGASTSGKPASGGKGKKAQASTADEFSIEYAASSRSGCKECEEKIKKGLIRVSKMDFDSDSAKRFGPHPAWRHLDCFVKVKSSLGFTDSAEKLAGFSSLNEEDQAVVKKKIKAVKKRKAEDPKEVPQKKAKEGEKNKEEKVLKAQSELFFKCRDLIMKELKKAEMTELLEINGQHPFPGISQVADSLADSLTFGVLNPCPECKGQLKLGSFNYKCTGNLTAWTSCQYTTKTPSRRKFIVPAVYMEDYEFLKDYKYVKKERVFPENPEAPTTSNGCEKPLDKFQVVIVGNPARGKEEAAKLITDLGGKLTKRITKNTNFVITTKDEAEKHKTEMKSAEEKNVFVLSEEFLDAIRYTGSINLVKEHQLFPWGGDPVEKLGHLGGHRKSKMKSLSEPSTSNIQKVSAHGKVVVDQDSGLCDVHVHEEDGNVFNAVLGLVNIQKGKNSYYKLQLLKHNYTNKYHLFTAWGRVGTKIGGKKIEDAGSRVEAVQQFKKIYLEKTDNDWDNRENFKKSPNFFYPLDIDYGQELVENFPQLKPGARSKLPMPIQQLITLIFDIENMKKAMLEFEIDLQKMPLGKLSKKQIQDAYSILTELQQVIQDDKNNMKILDASNRFYTLIPHDFGLRKPPMLDNDYLIQMKTQMLDSLLEIEVAYNLLKGILEDNEDPIDLHYRQLKTDIEVLQKDSREFQNIEKYLKNTHAETHKQFTLEILNVFKVNRSGELKRYNSKYKNLDNKKLLWHGSRIANYAGILSQGLRIAPPEAPSTGYMFGKGIYFADMVSKSANYCFTSAQNPTGLLMLCEVALGNMYERYESEYVEKLPKNKNSTKGVGQTMPNPKESIYEDGVEIPMGTPQKTDSEKRHALLYNEYIVYDVNQVNIKYLLEVDFKWKR